MMAEEGRQRFQTWTATGCNAFEGKRPMSKPMSFTREEAEKALEAMKDE